MRCRLLTCLRIVVSLLTSWLCAMELIEGCIIGINTATQVISEKISHLCHSSTFSNSLTTKSFVLYLAIQRLCFGLSQCWCARVRV